MRRYKNEFQVYNQTAVIEANCNEIAIINTGTQAAVINGALFPQGTSFAGTGNADEWDDTVYNLSFQGSGNPAVLVIRKVYQS